jgi:hypothetical protein
LETVRVPAKVRGGALEEAAAVDEAKGADRGRTLQGPTSAPEVFAKTLAFFSRQRVNVQ